MPRRVVVSAVSIEERLHIPLDVKELEPLTILDGRRDIGDVHGRRARMAGDLHAVALALALDRVTWHAQTAPAPQLCRETSRDG
jgi:hypothetical protein